MGIEIICSIAHQSARFGEFRVSVDGGYVMPVSQSNQTLALAQEEILAAYHESTDALLDHRLESLIDFHWRARIHYSRVCVERLFRKLQGLSFKLDLEGVGRIEKHPDLRAWRH